MADMADGFVQVAPDSTGKKIDNTEVTRDDTAVVVERQRVEPRDDEDNVLSTAAVVDQLQAISQQIAELAEQVRINNEIWLSIARG